jgi:hypothetical protein
VKGDYHRRGQPRRPSLREHGVNSEQKAYHRPQKRHGFHAVSRGHSHESFRPDVGSGQICRRRKSVGKLTFFRQLRTDAAGFRALSRSIP